MPSFAPLSAGPISGGFVTGGGIVAVPSMLGAPSVLSDSRLVAMASAPTVLGAPQVLDSGLAWIFTECLSPLNPPVIVAFAPPAILADIPGPMAVPTVWAVRTPLAWVAIPGPMVGPSVSGWHDWSLSAKVGRRSTIYVLEVVAAGLDPVRIPISGYQSRLRSGDPSYLQVSIPNAPAWAAIIAARAAGQMVLYGGFRLEDTGAELLEEIARVNIGLMSDQRGVRNQTLSVSGHAVLASGSPRTRTLRGVSYRASGGTGRKYRAAPDVMLRPGDTAIINEFGEQITVGLIVHVVGTGESTMEVSEAA